MKIENWQFSVQFYAKVDCNLSERQVRGWETNPWVERDIRFLF